MSIIQSIREKAAVLMFVVIGISLIAFLLMDGVGSRGSGAQSTVIGTINGKKLQYGDFQKQTDNLEARYKQSGMPVDESMRKNILDQVWNQNITERLLEEETSKLGMQVSLKEVDDYIFGANPPQDLRQQFTNPETGEYDVNALKNVLRELKADKTNQHRESFEKEYLPALAKQRLNEKYLSLLAAAAYVPAWMLEKMESDNNAVADIAFVNIPYNTIADSVAAITNDDITKYISKRKDKFKQDAARSILYVSFDAAPSSADSAAALAEITTYQEEFATTTDITNFLNKVGSETAYTDHYELDSRLRGVEAESIKTLADGQVFGPYLDGGDYTFAKLISKRQMPDSIKARHILIKTADNQVGQIRNDAEAKSLIDSIAMAIKGGAGFDAMVLKYSEDEGSKNTAGEYEFSSSASLVKPFYDVVFYEPVGTKKVVKAESQGYSGYHYIEVLSQKNFETAYKIAYLSKPILASTETETAASNAADQFAAESKSLASFQENIRNQNLQEFVAADIKENDFMVPGIGNARTFVKNVFKSDKGIIMEPENIGDKYIVAAITDVHAEGLMSATQARPLVETFVRNEKKALVIKDKVGNATTLEEIATKGNGQVSKADSIVFGSTFIQGAGSEPKVVGMAFNKEIAGKVSPLISGNSGVFALVSSNIRAEAAEKQNLDQLKQSMQAQMKQAFGNSVFEALKKAATIKDNRSVFY